MGNNYADAMLYELFIRKAHGYTSAQDKNGAHQSFMKNLMDAELGEPGALRVGSFDAQLEKVKDYLDKAMAKYLSPKLSAEAKEALEGVRVKFGSALSTKEILDLMKHAKVFLD